MVLGKLPVSGRPTNLDYGRARAYCACRRCGWGLFGHFFLSSVIALFSPSLWETARSRLKYCFKGPLNPRRPTNQPYMCQEFQKLSRFGREKTCIITKEIRYAERNN